MREVGYQVPKHSFIRKLPHASFRGGAKVWWVTRNSEYEIELECEITNLFSRLLFFVHLILRHQVHQKKGITVVSYLMIKPYFVSLF
jgi:hypothetical protein